MVRIRSTVHLISSHDFIWSHIFCCSKQNIFSKKRLFLLFFHCNQGHVFIFNNLYQGIKYNFISVLTVRQSRSDKFKFGKFREFIEKFVGKIRKRVFAWERGWSNEVIRPDLDDHSLDSSYNWFMQYFTPTCVYRYRVLVKWIFATFSPYHIVTFKCEYRTD